MENEIKYIDLFGGVGGFRLGIEQATQNLRGKSSLSEGRNSDSRSSQNLQSDGNKSSIKARCILYSDIDKYAVQTYNKNFKENYEATDIRTIKADSIQDFDMLCGGFPCQTFSIAGKRKGFEDTRGTLFYEIARILKAKRPRIVFLENVKGLLSHDRGRTFAIILSTLEGLGYDVQWMVLNSKFFGVPQNRERVFIIGSLRGTSRPEILPFGENDRQHDEKSFLQKTRDISKCITARYWKQGQSDQYIGEPKMIGQLQVEGEKRVNECPLEINQFLKKNKGKLTIKEIAEKIGEPSSKVEHYFRIDKSRAIPKPSVWLKLQQVLHFSDTYNKQVSELEKFYVEFEQTRRVYSDDMSPTLNAGQPSIHAVLTPDRENKRQNGRRFKEEGEPSFTLTGQDVHGVAVYDDYNSKMRTDGNIGTLTQNIGSKAKRNGQKIIQQMKIRRLTPIECERLQGFPDNWTEGVSDTQRYKQMGNAVTVNVIQALAEKLLFAFERQEVKNG